MTKLCLFKSRCREVLIFFICGYLHDKQVAKSEGETYVTSKCRASQKKSVKYSQRIVGKDGEKDLLWSHLLHVKAAQQGHVVVYANTFLLC